MKFIISGHANYGSGVKSSLDLILGSNSIESVDFDCELEAFKEKCNKVVDQEPTIIMCDLLGGTPFNIFAEISSRYENVRVLTHVSIAAIIECYTIYRDSDDLNTVVDSLKKISEMSIVEFSLPSINEEVESDEGI